MPVLWSQMDLTQILPLGLGFVTLVELFNLWVPQFPHL